MKKDKVHVVAENLTQIVKEKGYTFDQIAKILGVTRQQAYYLVKGKCTPSCYQLKAIADNFKLPMEYFFLPVL